MQAICVNDFKGHMIFGRVFNVLAIHNYQYILIEYDGEMWWEYIKNFELVGDFKDVEKTQYKYIDTFNFI